MFTGRKISWKVYLPVFTAVFFAFALAGTARAVEFIDDDTIPAGTTIDDDVFIAGQNVVIDGVVTGDVFATGRTVELNGEVQGSFIAAGQVVRINGIVGGSAYAGASSIELGPSTFINRNIYVGGFAFESANGSVVTKDLVMGGYQAVIDGEIGQDVLIGGGALEISGIVGGDVRADVGNPNEGMNFMQFYSPPGAPAAIPRGINITSDAKIGGEILYTGNVTQPGSIQAQPGSGMVFNTPMPDEISADTGEGPVVVDSFGRVSDGLEIGRWLLERVREFVTLMILGALVLWLIPDLFRSAVEKTRTEPLLSTFWGLLSLIVGFVGAFLIAGLILGLGILFSIITLGGLGSTVFGVGFSSLGLVFMIFILVAAYGSKLIVSFLGGKWILEKLAPSTAASKVWPLVVGVVIYVILRAIPIFGWLLGSIITLIGLGAVYLAIRETRRSASMAAP